MSILNAVLKPDTFSLNLPHPDKKFSKVLLAFVFWTLVAALFTTKTNLYYTFKGIPTSWLHLSIHHVAPAWCWLLFMPLVYACYNKVLKSKKAGLLVILSLLMVISAISVSHRLLSFSADIAFRKAMGYIDGSIWYNLSKADSILVSGVFDSALICVLMLSFFHIQSLLRSKANGESVISYVRNEEHMNTVMVKSNGEFLRLELSQLMMASAAGNYIKICSKEDKPILIRETMKKFHGRLPAEKFIRVNRSCILNVDFIQGFRPRYNGDYTITLVDGTEVHTSSTFGKEWKQVLSS